MGVRGELFSTRVSRENRTYFFNVKENRVGDMFLSLVESKQGAEGDFERHQIMVFEEDFADFAEGIEKVLNFVKRERYKRATGKSGRGSHGTAAPRAEQDEPSQPAAKEVRFRRVREAKKTDSAGDEAES